MLYRLLLAGILTVSLAPAQRGGGGGGRNGNNNMNQGPMMAASKNRFDQISDALKLNKDQKKELKTNFDDAQKEASPVRDQMAKSRMAIAEAIQAGKNPDEINQLVNGQAELQSQMASIELRAFAKLYKTLDGDQQKATQPVFQMMRGIFSGKNWTAAE